MNLHFPGVLERDNGPFKLPDLFPDIVADIDSPREVPLFEKIRSLAVDAEQKIRIANIQSTMIWKSGALWCVLRMNGSQKQTSPPVNVKNPHGKSLYQPHRTDLNFEYESHQAFTQIRYQETRCAAMTAMISAKTAKSLKVGQLVGVNFERFSEPTCCADPSYDTRRSWFVQWKWPNRQVRWWGMGAAWPPYSFVS